MSGARASTWLVAARTAVSRLSNRFAALTVFVATLTVVVVARLERSDSPRLAIDNTLLGVTFGIVVPLTAYVAVARVGSFGRISSALDTLSRYGVSRRLCVSAALAVLLVTTALFSSFLAGLAVLVAGSGSGVPLLGDLGTSAWIGALAGMVYAAVLSLGATFGARGGGRFIVLAADFALGSSSALAAAFVPRGHVRNLLGGTPPLDMSQGAACFALAALGFSCAALTLLRTPA